MSITSTLHNATSGLAASARAIQVVSANLANAMTPDYGPREIDLAASTLGGTGGGVRVHGVSRSVDAGLLGLARDSGSASAQAQATLRFWQAAESALGLPGEGISEALARFDAAIIAAVARPDLDSRLAAVADSAGALVTTLAGAGDAVQARRAEADAAIARDVESLNDGLARIDLLNDQIVRLRSAGQSTLGLEDERQSLISTLADIVPLREQQRPDGRIALYSGGGALLVDLEAVSFGFFAAPAMAAAMTLGAGLSDLTLRGSSIDTGVTGPLAGGRLAAHFDLRDVASLQVQSALDGFATGLVNRFAESASDPTLPPGAPGLFTDAGAAASVLPGLTARLAVNAAVRPEAGGALWRIRDGIGAGAPGDVGDGRGLSRLAGALDRKLASVPGSPARSLADDLGNLLSQVSTRRHGAEIDAAAKGARVSAIREQRLAQGVDTDAELQRLMQIEQAYAANARVISTADAMLRQLLEI